jgi:hypothetical protein
LGYRDVSFSGLLTVKPITILRKLAKQGHRGYPVATVAFYGPDDRKASKAVLGVIRAEGAEPELHKWFQDSSEADLRYDIKLQNTWIDMMRRAGVRSLAMLEEINGCPHEEGVDYPVGEACPLCPFWAHGSRPLEEPTATAVTAIAFYKKEQWEELLASAEDRDNLERTWDEWNAQAEEMTQKMRKYGIRYVRVELDIEEIKEYCEQQGVSNNAAARAQLAALKARSRGR